MVQAMTEAPVSPFNLKENKLILLKPKNYSFIIEKKKSVRITSE